MSDPKATGPSVGAEDERPPFLGTWARLYAFVLVYLAAVIALFWLFTRHYAPNS